MFIKNIVKLSSSTAFSQLIPFLLLPFLASFLGTEQFGEYTIFYTTAIMFGTLASLRFDYSINSATSGSNAKDLFSLCVIFSFVTSVILFLIIILLVIFSGLKFFWLLLPLSSLLVSVSQSYLSFANYTNMFNAMSMSRVLNSISCVTFQFLFVVVLGFNDGVFIGLIFGYILSIIFLFYKVPPGKIEMRWKRLYSIARKYKSYPIYILPGSVVNFLSGNFVVYSISFIFGPSLAGLYGLAVRIAGAPTAMIARSISEVYKSKAMYLYQKDGHFKAFFLNVTVLTTFVALAGFGLLYFISKMLILSFFGTEWLLSVDFIKYLIPMFILQFVTTSVGYSLMISNKQKADFKWQVLRLLLVACAFLVSYFNGYSVDGYVISFSLSLSLSFIVYLYICYRSSLPLKA